MLDIQYIRDNKEKVKEAAKLKNIDSAVVDHVLVLDEERRRLIKETETLRAERNSAAKDKDIEKGKTVKDKLQKIEPELREAEEEYLKALYKVPNLFSDDTPVGKDETENKVIRAWGEPTEFAFKAKDHMEIGEDLGLINTEKASEISGARFAYLLGDAVLLQFALVQFAFNTLTDKEVLGKIAKKVSEDYPNTPFIPVVPPVFVKEDVFGKMDRLEPKDDRYFIPSDELYLIGSAEHTLGPFHMNETLSEKELPLRYVGFSTSFRREAGSYGKDTRGILRLHQFDKLEMESFTTPENGQKEQDFFVAIQEYLMQSLKIPYQVMAICSGDMGKPDYRQIDINSWMPGQNKYRETHTSDMMTDYQSRRLNTKVQQGSETNFVYMNDATAFAIGRTIIAILENYQNEDGSVSVPEVLQPFMGKDKITRQ